jgi:predicted RNA-binding Zn ribbon-like protein
MTTAAAAPVPPHVALLRTFANTLDRESATDALTDPCALASWLREQGLSDAHTEATGADVALAHALREGLRAAMAAHRDDAAGVATPLDRAAAELPLRLHFAGSEPRLEPAVAGVRAALARILVAVVDAHADGSWRRLKICPADDCGWAYYDTSKNRTRVWCAMGVCGNRTKTRAYRARLRASGQAPTPSPP